MFWFSNSPIGYRLRHISRYVNTNNFGLEKWPIALSTDSLASMGLIATNLKQQVHCLQSPLFNGAIFMSIWPYLMVPRGFSHITYLYNVQIELIVTKLYLNYMHSFFASTSDFWAQPILMHSFGGCIANIMANGYCFHNRMFLAFLTLQWG